MSDLRPFEDLRTTGLLWLINRVVFHPRGYALSIVSDEQGHPAGWRLLGDGSEPWRFEGFDERDLMRRVEATFRADRLEAGHQ